MFERDEADLVVLNCGGGRQSTALVLMACHGLIPKPDVVLMADTGWERKQTARYWEQIIVPACQKAGIPVELVRRVHTHETQRGQAGNIREDTLRSVREGTRIANAPLFVDKGDGKRGKLRRACTAEYKIDPITKAIRRRLGLRPRQRAAGRFRVVNWIGIATEESQRANGNSGLSWATLRYPLLEMEMSTADCIRIIQDLGYPVPVKSACIGCPFRSDASWARMKHQDPVAWADAVDFDRRLRDPNGKGRLNDGLAEADYEAGKWTLKGSTFPAYLHPSCKPLDEVDLPADLLQVEGESFGGEC